MMSAFVVWFLSVCDASCVVSLTHTLLFGVCGWVTCTLGFHMTMALFYKFHTSLFLAFFFDILIFYFDSENHIDIHHITAWISSDQPVNLGSKFRIFLGMYWEGFGMTISIHISRYHFLRIHTCLDILLL